MRFKNAVGRLVQSLPSKSYCDNKTIQKKAVFILARTRNEKASEWLTKENLVRIQGWARDGLTDAQIMHNMGIGHTTFYRWKSEHKEIRDALKNGKEVVDYLVENALLKRALSGDTTACIYWLKNRKPNEWRDHRKQETDFSGDGVEIINDATSSNK